MTILEITDETGVSYYEILNLSPEALVGLDEKPASKKIRDAAKIARGECEGRAQKGNKEAEDRLTRINVAETALKNLEDRKKYDQEMESGEVLRVQRIAPPFFWDRNVRFRVIERLMREAGLAPPRLVSVEA